MAQQGGGSGGAPAGGAASGGSGAAPLPPGTGAYMQQLYAQQALADDLRKFWQRCGEEVEEHSEALAEFKAQALPLARIKKAGGRGGQGWVVGGWGWVGGWAGGPPQPALVGGAGPWLPRAPTSPAPAAPAVPARPPRRRRS